jgi:predicted nuclease with TOPRIM domain
MDNMNFDKKVEKGGGEINKNKSHQEEFNAWSVKYNELHKKLDLILARDKQLDERFHKFWKLRDDFNDRYMEMSKKLEDSDNGKIKLSDDERDELDKTLDKMYEKLEKFSKVIDTILGMSKLNDPSEIWGEIEYMENELRNELDYDLNDPFSTHKDKEREKMYDND